MGKILSNQARALCGFSSQVGKQYRCKAYKEGTGERGREDIQYDIKCKYEGVIAVATSQKMCDKDVKNPCGSSAYPASKESSDENWSDNRLDEFHS